MIVVVFFFETTPCTKIWFPLSVGWTHLVKIPDHTISWKIILRKFALWFSSVPDSSIPTIYHTAPAQQPMVRASWLWIPGTHHSFELTVTEHCRGASPFPKQAWFVSPPRFKCHGRRTYYAFLSIPYHRAELTAGAQTFPSGSSLHAVFPSVAQNHQN